MSLSCRTGEYLGDYTLDELYEILDLIEAFIKIRAELDNFDFDIDNIEDVFDDIAVEIDFREQEEDRAMNRQYEELML